MANYGKALGSFGIDLKLDDTAFKKGLEGVKKQTRYWAQEMKTSMRLADQYGTKEDKLAAKKEGLTNVIAAQRKELDELVKRYEGSYDKATKKAGEKTLDYAREVKKAEQNLSMYEKQLEGVSKELQEYQRQQEISKRKLVVFGDDMIKVGAKLEKTGEKMSKIGSSLTKAFTVPLTLGVGAAVKASADFEDAFSGVRKTVEASEKQFDNLRTSFLDMSEEIPVSASELANLGEVAGQLGIETENIDEFVRVIADLGVATNLAGEEGAASLAKFASVMDMSQADFDRLGSSIVDLGNNFATTEKDILDMSLRLAGVGNQLNMSEADVLGISAALSQVGVEAEAGGSAMTQALKKMNNAVAGGTEELDSFAKTAGMTREEFSNLFKEDAAKALQAYVEGLEKASKNGENLNDVLGEVGIKGIREADALLRLAGNSKILGEALGISGEAWEDNTALTEEAQEKYKTFHSQLDIFKNMITEIGIELGGPFMEALNSAMDASKPLLDTFKNLAKSFTDLPKKTQQNIVKFTGLAIAAGPLLKIFGGLTSGFGGLLKTFGKGSKLLGTLGFSFKGLGGIVTGFATGPVGLTVLAIAGIGTAFYLAYKKSEPFKQWVDDLIDKIVEFSTVVYNDYLKPAIDEIVTAFANMFKKLKEFWEANGKQFIEALTNFFGFVWAMIQPALGFWVAIFNTTFKTIVNLAKVSWDFVKGIFSGAFKIIGGLIKIFTGVFTGDWSKMWDGVKDIAKGSWNIIATRFEAFVNAFLSVAEGLSNGITKGIVGAVNGVIKAVSWILDKFGLDKLKEWEVGEIKIKRVTLPKFAKGSGGLLMDTLGVVNDQKGSNYREMIIPPKGEPFIPRGRDVVLPMQKGTQIVPASITKEFTDSLPHFKKGTGGLFRNVWEGTKNTVGKLWGKVKDFTGNIMDYFDKPKELVQYAVNKFTNIPELPSFWLDMAHGAVKHTSSKAVGFVKSKFDDFMSSSNFVGDTSIGSNGVYSYLMNIARGLMRKYNMIFTSGFRPGDPYDHGKGLAVDIALPGVVNGSPIYQAAAEDAIRMPGIKYVITNGKWKHKGKSWVPWPDGDHYDHVHISGEKPVQQMASQALGGSWAAQIKRAAAVMGQSVTPSELAGIQAQIQRESGGNQRIVQSSAVWDVNMASGNPAKGLLQYVPSTFNNYKVRGYEDIFNGFHQLLAFFNNSNWRRDLPYGRSGWGPSGSRIKPYANGGLVNRHQLAEIAEGNKPEMIIPLTKKTRAVELINKAKSIIGMENGSVVVNNDTERLEALVAKQADMVESMSEKMIALLEVIAQKELTIDKQSLVSVVDYEQGQRVSLNFRGLA